MANESITLISLSVMRLIATSYPANDVVKNNEETVLVVMIVLDI